MGYWKAKEKAHQEDMTYRIYLTDVLFASSQNKTLVKRYYDIIFPKEIDPRSADEIAEDIINTLGLKVE